MGRWVIIVSVHSKNVNIPIHFPSGIKIKKSKDENVSVVPRPQIKPGTQIVGNEIQLVVNHFRFTIGIPKVYHCATQLEPESLE